MFVLYVSCQVAFVSLFAIFPLLQITFFFFLFHFTFINVVKISLSLRGAVREELC